VTPEEMAALHGASFTMPRPWSAAEFAALLASQRVFALTAGAKGLLLGQVVADEAELLTIAVHPTQRHQGLGRKLVQDFLGEARVRSAASAFLEVAASNDAAIALYHGCGFAETGKRRGYYHGPDGAVDAVLMRYALRGA